MPASLVQERLEFRRITPSVPSVPHTNPLVPPDTTAAIFWLKNRRPDRWRDKQDIKLSGGVDIKRDYSKLTDAQLEELEKLTKKIDVTDPDA